ncbi:hypothetical protein MXB_2253 [Myxobolus squamalis]|nr:hypothetical protein MXB_2253 [Myxobolus squamalis]
MSHESGITTSDELRQFIATAKSGIVRSFKVIICNEKMELGGQYNSVSTLEIDFNQSVALYVDAIQPCYIMMRLDSKNSDDIYHWLLILFCPDHAQTTEKMKYASTRSSFKRQFGSHLITSELFFDTKAEVNYQAYQDHIRSKDFPEALTDLEKFALETEKNDGVDVETQKIVIFCTKNIGSEQIESITPQNEPRFHIFSFKYNKNGDSFNDKVT